jgi:ribokinase
VGRIGADGAWLLQRLRAEGVDTTHIVTDEAVTGHAVIQVVPSGENAIVLYGGANLDVTESDIDAALVACSPDDLFLVQNETSVVALSIRKAHAKGLKIVFNPAPMNSSINDYPLELVDYFILNETEAEGLTGVSNPDAVRAVMRNRFPRAATVLTLGSKGAMFMNHNSSLYESALRVDVVDTTAAGDTFIGFFLAECLRSGDYAKALAMGCQAAAICVTRAGASNSIPLLNELANT